MKKKRGLCLAVGLVPETSERQILAGLGALGKAAQPEQPQGYSADTDPLRQNNASMNYQFGLQSENGRGAQFQFANQTMAEKQQAAGINPNAAYKPGGPADTHGFVGLRSLASTQPDTTPLPQRRPAPTLAMPNPMQKGLGMAEGGIVRGKGTGTSDDVPMKLAGRDVNLSNTEAVLPAKTVQALGGPEAVEELIEATNGKPPVKGGLRAGGDYNRGGFVDDFGTLAEPNKFQKAPEQAVLRQQLAAAQPAAQAAPTGQVATSGATGAQQPVAQAAKQGLAARALGYLSPVATGTAIGMGVANMVDSFPSLRGRATAEASNMELAGTPQHDAEVHSALVAQDKNWEQRHGKTLTDAQRTQPLGAQAAKPVVAEAPKHVGLTAASTLADRQVEHMENNNLREFRDVGAGIVAQRGANGRLSVSNVGTGDITDKDKALYTDKDGKPTNDWTKTSEYAQGVKQAEKDKASLRQLQYSNALFNATNPEVKDPRAVAAGMRGLAQFDAEAANAAKVNANALELGKFKHELQKTANLQANNERDFDHKETEAHTKKVDDLVKSWATDKDGKLDNAKYVGLQKYASQFARKKGMSADEHIASLIDNFAVDNLFDTEGRHVLGAESVRNGEAVLPKVSESGLSAWFHGRGAGQPQYTNPLTNETIYQSDVLKNLSPNQQKILAERIAAMNAQQSK